MPDAAPDSVVASPEPVATNPSELVPPSAPNRDLPVDSRQPPSSPQPQPPNPAAVATAQNVAKHAALGRAAQFLLGSHTEYDQTPQGPVPKEVPNKPGELMRHILAGALLGGGMGAHEATFARGAMTGAAGAQQNGREQDEQRRQQAQQQYQNSLTAKREQREQESHQSEMEMNRANISLHNTQTLYENKMIQGQDYAFHKQVAEDGKAQFDSYIKAGVKPAYTDVSESEHAALQKSNPDAYRKYVWLHTGNKITVGDDGTPHYEGTYSAIDPTKGSVITKDQLALYKKARLDKAYPEFSDVLKEGKKLDAQQTLGLHAAYNQLHVAQLEEQTQTLDLKDKQARINHLNAEAAKDYNELAKSKLETKQAQLFSEALKDYNENGGDITKVKPGNRLVLGESSSKILSSIRAELKEARDTEGAGSPRVVELTQQFDSVSRLVSSALSAPKSASQAELVSVQIPGQPLGHVRADQLDDFMKQHPNAVRVGEAVPSAPPTGVSKLVHKVAGAIGDSVSKKVSKVKKGLDDVAEQLVEELDK